MAKVTMTQAMALTLAIDFINGVDMPETVDMGAVADKLSAMVDTLNKKSASKKPTKAQEENVGYMNEILNVLVENGSPMTIKQICSKSEVLAEFSTSKMSALLKKLVENGSVSKTYEKKQAFFTAC